MAKAKIAPVAEPKVASTRAGVVKAEILPDDEDGAIPALELTPYVAPNKSFEVRGNFDALKKALTSRRDEIITKKFTAKDIDTVTKYKKEAQGYRITLDGLEKDTKTRYFNAPKDIFTAQMATLKGIVADIEAKADKVLDAEEQKRCDALTQVFDIYKETFQGTYSLTAAGLAKIEYKNAYYNKTAKEAVTKADIAQQFVDIKAKEKARASGERMIRAVCGENKLLDVEKYVGNLDTNELANIIDAIEAEKKRLADAAAEAALDAAGEEEVDEFEIPASEGASSSSASPEAVKVGVIGAATRFLGSGSDFPGRTKTRVIDLIYPADLGDALSVIFKELANYGIKVRDHKETF